MDSSEHNSTWALQYLKIEQRYRIQRLTESLRLHYGKGTESRMRRFQCTCSYCWFNRDPSKDNYENYYNTTYSNYATELNES
ncbi:hypothetical protein FD754_003331 [Muntiacus muntjak]|uniref:Uncharacterized protein n=1 Tax=Muntiacus muntjak TaxID=9888 RepID=A0A5N3WER2_MUNMU|nr:hypothetical protein FD754_003331 [Muntiacus muntjak]